MTGVSIIICTYNGVEKLPATLKYITLLKSQYPWELIVVDNASKDDTYIFCKDFLERSNLAFKVLKFDTPGKMYAFWHGLAHAQYDYILDCDDDNHLAENYIEIGLSLLKTEHKIGALGGCGHPVVSVPLPDWFSAFSKSYAVGPQARQNGPLTGNRLELYGAGCFFKKEALIKLQKLGFQSALSCRKGDTLSSGGDTELCMAIHRLGYDIWYSGELRFGHAIPASRLTWEYYLRLKEGIASSFPLLEAYRYNEFSSGRAFELFLWRKYFIAIKGYIKLTVTLLFYYSREAQVARRVCKTKIASFGSNYSLALKSYSTLKRIFSSTLLS